MQAFSLSKAWVQNILQVFHDIEDDFVLGQGAMTEVVDAVGWRIGAYNRIGEPRQLFFKSEVRRHVVWFEQEDAIERRSRLSILPS